MQTIRSALALIFVLSALGGLAGCGQKGDLYLPGDDPEKKEQRR